LAVKTILDEDELGKVVMILSRVAFGPYIKALG